MNNIAIIPARSGSKGLKNKNIKELNGKPLLAYTIETALESKQFTRVMVSTDSEMYAKLAVQYGAEVPFLRTEATSNDEAGSWNVVYEVLERYKQFGELFVTACLLQPTSPLRKAEDIIDAYCLYEEKHAEAVTSVCEVEHSPLWTMNLPFDNSMREFRRNIKTDAPRQKLRTFYRLNGAIYIRKISYLNDDIIVHNEDEYAYIMHRKNSVDIDTLDDFEYAEFLIKKEVERS